MPGSAKALGLTRHRYAAVGAVVQHPPAGRRRVRSGRSHRAAAGPYPRVEKAWSSGRWKGRWKGDVKSEPDDPAVAAQVVSGPAEARRRDRRSRKISMKIGSAEMTTMTNTAGRR